MKKSASILFFTCCCLFSIYAQLGVSMGLLQSTSPEYNRQLANATEELGFD